jgi:TonB family protein
MSSLHASTIAGVLVALCAAAPAAQAQLDSARKLYASASYEEALNLLAAVRDADVATTIEAEQYRALCLLAIGRPGEAHEAVRRIVAQNPLYSPAGRDVSPRIAALFEETRRELLPGIARTSFGEAKALFVQQEHQRAYEILDRVAQIISDPAVSDLVELDDLRLVADGLLILAKAKTASAPVSAPASHDTPPPSPPVSSAPTVFSSNDKDVTVPAALVQEMPVWRSPGGLPPGAVLSGLVRLVIDENGSVEGVTLLRGIHPSYDAALVRAAREWKFRPALKAGQPVKYAKIIQIQLRS